VDRYVTSLDMGDTVDFVCGSNIRFRFNIFLFVVNKLFDTIFLMYLTNHCLTFSVIISSNMMTHFVTTANFHNQDSTLHYSWGVTLRYDWVCFTTELRV